MRDLGCHAVFALRNGSTGLELDAAAPRLRLGQVYRLAVNKDHGVVLSEMLNYAFAIVVTVPLLPRYFKAPPST